MFRVFVISVLLVTIGVQAHSQTSAPPGTSEGSLAEIKDKRSAKFFVIRSRVVNSPGHTIEAAVEAIRSGEDSEQKHWLPYSVIARKLNKYIRQYKTMTAAEGAAEVDFYIVFNLARYRRILNGIYPSGEMFVMRLPPEGLPRVLWRSEKEMLAEDAASSLIRALKVVHGQK